MRNKGKRAMLALILLGALFLLSGCVSSVEIKGASRDSAPTSGTLVLHAQRQGSSGGYTVPETVKIKDGSTITLKRTDGLGEDVVLKNPEIENDDKTTGTMDICFAYDGLKPGKYQIVTDGTMGYIRGLTVTLGIKDEKDGKVKDEDVNVAFYVGEDGASQYAITVVSPPEPTAVPTAVPDTSNLPKTGDGSSPALWLAVCLGCAAAVALLLRKRSAR